ncbi:MAG: hypothetical protein IIT65_03305 [Lachnospiraceae bacterium]|nr:hypothetical protein [Lachnospiraceae bacterium]
MKKFLTLCVAFLASFVTFAQQQLATLNHNDTITAYYGATALQQAHAAAVNGDVITLSSGTFSAADITKLITIRGNGMEDDSIAGTKPTVISGDFLVTIPTDSVNQLKIDGVKIPNGFQCNEMSNAQISRCHIAGFSRHFTSSYCKNTQFVNCIIHSVYLHDSYQAGYNGNRTENNQFVNCVILQLGGSDLRDNSGNPLVHNCQLINCIAKVKNWHLAYSYQNVPAYSCTNCILYDDVHNESWFSTLNNTAYCNNCIGININSAVDTFFFNGNHSNHNFSAMEFVFKYFNGTYSEGMSFELDDSIATTFLGTDGTEIGIYGGMVPFNPRVSPR